MIALFEQDPETELIVMVGEIGGDEEERTAEYIAEHVTKPVVAYIAGFEAPPGKRMGHAGAIISGSSGTAQAKAEALEAKGVPVGPEPDRGGADRGRAGRGQDAVAAAGYPPPCPPPDRSPSPAARPSPDIMPPDGPAERRPRRWRGPGRRAGYGAGLGYAPLRAWIAERTASSPSA